MRLRGKDDVSREQVAQGEETGSLGGGNREHAKPLDLRQECRVRVQGHFPELLVPKSGHMIKHKGQLWTR